MNQTKWYRTVDGKALVKAKGVFYARIDKTKSGYRWAVRCLTASTTIETGTALEERKAKTAAARALKSSGKVPCGSDA